MAKSKKSQFGPALKASFLVLLITGSAVGYVWQKDEIDHLGQKIRQQKVVLRQMIANNQRLADQYAALHEPMRLEQRAKELNLGLEPLQPDQVVRIVEPSATVALPKPEHREWAVRNDAVAP